MQCKAVCNLSEYPINSIHAKKQLRRTFRNNIELADYLIGDTFIVVTDFGHSMLVQSTRYAKELYIVPMGETQCFKFE